MNDFVTATLVGLASRMGKFETKLLNEIDTAGNDAYCAELARRLSLVEKREVSLGQVSRTLGNLRRLGLATSEQRWPDTPQKHQRHRLVFSLTPTGRTIRSALQEKMPRSLEPKGELTHAN